MAALPGSGRVQTISFHGFAGDLLIAKTRGHCGLEHAIRMKQLPPVQCMSRFHEVCPCLPTPFSPYCPDRLAHFHTCKAFTTVIGAPTLPAQKCTHVHVQRQGQRGSGLGSTKGGEAVREGETCPSKLHPCPVASIWSCRAPSRVHAEWGTAPRGCGPNGCNFTSKPRACGAVSSALRKPV